LAKNAAFVFLICWSIRNCKHWCSFYKYCSGGLIIRLSDTMWVFTLIFCMVL